MARPFRSGPPTERQEHPQFLTRRATRAEARHRPGSWVQQGGDGVLTAPISYPRPLIMLRPGRGGSGPTVERLPSRKPFCFGLPRSSYPQTGGGHASLPLWLALRRFCGVVCQEMRRRTRCGGSERIIDR